MRLCTPRDGGVMWDSEGGIPVSAVILSPLPTKTLVWGGGGEPLNASGAVCAGVISPVCLGLPD